MLHYLFVPRRARNYEPLGVSHIGTLLAEAIGDEQRVRHALGVWPAWDEAVGLHVARAARPVSLRNGVLTVRVRTSAWMQELTAMRESLVRRLQRASGGAAVKNLRVEIAHDDEPAAVAPSTASVPGRSLGAAIPYDLAKEIRAIGSSNLRASMLAAAASWAQRQPPPPSGTASDPREGT